MQITNISDAKANLSHLIKRVQENNETIIIGKAGKPVAVLSAYKEDDSPRKLGGSWEGKVIINADSENTIIDSFYNSKIFPDKQ
ncbi:MAG: type II toxin-antitoxin system Phd/YefM family antitoxin [Thiohalomonadales bacterium]